MNFTDIIALAIRNLRQSKLRTTLTMLGVVIGVGAIVTMVSFGLGLQRNLLRDAFARIDLFTSITIIGPGADALLALSDDRAGRDQENGGAPLDPPARVLDAAALAELRAIPGVRYVQPQITYQGIVRFEGRTRRIAVGGAPSDIEFNPRFNDLVAGRYLQTPSSAEIIITERFLANLRRQPGSSRPGGGPFRPAPLKSEEERRREAAAAIGQRVTLLTLPGEADTSADSVVGLPLPANSTTLNTAGYEERTYQIVGVLRTGEGIDFTPGGSALAWLPLAEVERLRQAQGDPLRQLGELIAGETGYQNLELRVADLSRVEAVREELRRRRFNFFSLSNQLEEVRRVFLIVNASLALIGGLALLVASFGISNTMIMSIRERTREIGIMKAIGGSDAEIVRIFFVEAGLIGLAGGLIGLVAGWGVDRIANILANRWIARQAGQGLRQIDFFSIPWYLAAGAILFALLVSLIAAIYPARHAAKVDPVIALR
ncbi:MAG: ABC transporter permease [Blastocatellia bacterium]